jgi:hypothetical protein
MAEGKRAIILAPLLRYLYTRCCGDDSIVANLEIRDTRRKFGTRWKA